MGLLGSNDKPDYVQRFVDTQARGAFASGYEDSATPEITAQDIQKARELGVSVNEAKLMTPAEKAQAKADSLMRSNLLSSMPVYKAKAVESPNLFKLTKDDPINAGILESLWWKMGGETGKPEGVFDALSNSFTRGGYGLANAGNMSEWQVLQEQRKKLRAYDEGIAAGKSNAEVFGDSDFMSADRKRALYDRFRARLWGELERAEKDLAGDIAHTNYVSSLFPQSDSMRKVTEAESFGEAAGAFLSSPVENLANVGPESVVQYAPAAPALAAASMAGGPALAAALAGFYSQKIDEKSTMAGAVSEEAKDATEAGSVLGVLRDATKMGQMGEKALAHSIPVGILDGLSLGLAGKTFLPNKIVSAFSEGGKRWAHFGTQAVAQGAMGGTGEALGQVAAEGKVTNWGDVVAEIAGEGFGAPVEIATISAKNWAQAKQTQAIAQQQKQVRQATVEAIQNNKLLERDTETAKEYIKQVGEASGVSEVVFDSEVLRQEEGVFEALLKHFPGKADEINRALENGGSVSIPVEDAFVAIKQDPEFANAYVEHAEIKGVPGEALAAEDAEVAQDTMKSSTQAAMGSAGEQMVSELKEINGVIETALEGLLGSKEKAKAGTALFSTLVSNMAEDLGVSPKQFWEEHGVKKFVGENKQGVKGGYLARAKEIIFSKDADMSTVAHEFGHFFLDAYLDTAFGLDAAGELTAGRKHVLDNAGGVLKWLGVDSSKWAGMSVEERRPYHEKFARTFEAYLWEGHAPGKSLASVFRRFKAWLRKVYAVIAAIPEAEMNDDVRNLMDSLLVAHNAVEEAKARRALSGVAAVLAENMRGDPSISPVMEALRERDEAAEEWLLAKLLKDAAVLGRMRTAKYKELQKEASRVYSDYTDRELEKLRKEPETKLYNLLTSGIERNGKRIRPKLVEGELKSLGLTEAQISELKDRNMIYDPEVDGQVPANGEDLAREYGYTSYSHMAVAMSQAAEPIDRARVNASKRLSDEASPFASPDGLRKAADIAVMNEAQERVLINTIRAVDKTYKISAQERAWFHELAERQLGGMRLKDIKPEAFRQRAALRGKDALKAIKNNDPIAAGRALRQQLYQTILAREAQKLQGRRAKFLAQAKRLNKKEVKTLETKYLIMIQAILDKAGIKIKADFLRDRVPLASFMQTCFEEQEAVPAVDPNFENELAGVNGDFASMTGETFNRLCDTVDVLLKYGKDAKLVRLGNEAVELSEVKTKLESALEASSEAHGRERKGDMEKTGMAARALNWVHQVGLSHARMQSVFKVFDDGKAGAFFDFLIRPTDEAAATETRLKREFTRKMAEAFRPLYAKGVMGLEHAVYHESVGVSVTRGQVIAMALNMGNQGNADRLVGGSHLWKEITKGRELTEADVLTLISETLTKEELEAVQKVWDVFEDMRPRLHEQQKRLTGRTPKWVEPRPLIVRLPNGELVTLKGGYYPIMYDSRASDRGAAVAELRNAFAGSAGTPKGTHTYGGFLETRAKKVKNLAVALTPQAGFDGLDNAIHRLAWEEATINAWKVFKAVRPMIRDIYGADMVKAIETWLKANALGDLVQAAPGEEIARFARHGVSMAGLGFNVVTAIIQLPGIINSVPNIGSRWVGKGISQFLAMGPKNAAEFVRAKSEMMTDRATTQFRELSEIQGLAAGTASEAKNKFMNLAYKPIVIMQTAVDIPTWLGAYNKALSEGNTDDRAVAIADRAVLDAQGSGRASDLSAIERSGAWAKLFTVFYTFFNAILNNLVVSGKTKNKLNFAFDLILVIGVQTVIEQMLREGLKEAAGSGNGDDYWDRVLSASGKGVVSFSAGMLVGVREFSSIVGGYDYKGPTGMRKVNDVIRLTQQIGQGEVDEALVKSAVSAFGSFFGIPSAPINRAISGGNALRKGKTDSWLAPFLGYSEH